MAKQKVVYINNLSFETDEPVVDVAVVPGVGTFEFKDGEAKLITKDKE
ncbi:hypothetical protein GWO43_30215 [candidate division KSB1 bacterium]|nr:hypothetical protein [candidate division KSB1 bacterium]NIV70633.1 hypothetical protein [Phycisphaerae bacterium]NIS28166.1 hypothetical protein [candidate division KSB1 bacterium]NIT75058.1 hypothetical protein [candidate division KSB1 bacterium]NIU28844.1 hypothetical protein [candidate division KSB1 bacterium]